MENKHNLLEDDDLKLREILRASYEQKRALNPKYSWRAFALQLKIDQSLLGKFLRAERTLSKVTRKQLTQKLGLSTSIPTESNPTYKTITEAQLQVLGDWLGFAILEVLKTKRPPSTSEAIAKRFGVETKRVTKTIENLKRVGMLRSIGSRLVPLPDGFEWNISEQTSFMRANLQQNFTTLAFQAIEKTPYALRESSSLTITASSNRIGEIRKRILRFKKSLDQYLQETGPHDEVYQLLISFFPLTEIRAAEEKV